MLWAMVSSIDIAMTSAEARLLPRADCYIVVDALRATTTIAALFHQGLRSLRVVDSLESGLAAKAGAPDALLFGESGGLRPAGFDHGNSPAEAATLDVAGRAAVLVTSNGTVALRAVGGLGLVVAGSMANLSAVARFAAGCERVMVVCSGNGGASRFSLEDFAVAAALVQELQRGSPGAALGDGGLLAMAVESPEALVPVSVHAGITRALGFTADVSFACHRDAAPSVPVVTACGEGWVTIEDRSGES